MSALSARRAVFHCALAVALSGPAALLGQPPAVQFRNEFVPQESLAEHVQGLIPIKRSEFERLVKPFTPATPENQPGDAPYVEQAVYQARFSEGQLLEGTATLSI